MSQEEGPLGVIRGATPDISKLSIDIRHNSVIRIGRAPTNEIIVDAEFISGVHCEIFSRFSNETYDTVVYLTDKSANGTYLNKCLIGYNRTVALFSGCVISLASSHLNLVFVGQDRSRAPAFLCNDDIVITDSYIGIGGQANVCLAYAKNNSKRQFACRLNNTTDNSYQDEIATMKRNKHPNVMSIVRICENSGKMHMFLPLYTGGTLQERLHSVGRISESDARFFFYQIALGLRHIHSNNIIHLDIKPQNILCDSNVPRPRIIITDFGLSVDKSQKKKIYASDYGTYINHPPEIINNEAYDEKVDYWAAGLILYMMLTGRHPFVELPHEFNKQEVKKAILYDEPNMNEDPLSECSEDVKDLIAKLLMKDPAERGSSEDCIRSPWILHNYEDDTFIHDYVSILENYNKERVDFFEEEPKNYEYTDIIPRWYEVEKYHCDLDPKAVDQLRERRRLSCYVKDGSSLSEKGLTPLFRFKVSPNSSFEKYYDNRL